MEENENLKKYDEVFCSTFMVGQEELTNLKYQDVEAWDSVGHMNMIAELEDAFDIEMDIDDIIDFTDYQTGKEMVGKYGVEL